MLEAPAVSPAADGRDVARAAVASIGVGLPDEVVPSSAIAAGIDVDEDWIVTRTGVRERRRAAPDEELADYATRAGAEALARAGFDPADLDLVIVATLTADQVCPNAAPVVAERLGARGAGAYDLGAACTGFLSGLDAAAARIESGRAGAVLVIGADLLSRVLDYSDRGTAALFGDGAGAALVTRASAGGRIGSIVLRSDGSGASCIVASHGDRLLRMRGQDTFRAAVPGLVASTLEALDREDLALGDVDLFVYHQANDRIITAVGARLGLDAERVVRCIDRYGNTSAASLPIALAEAERDGRLEPGATVLLGAFGAGFVYGAGVVRWGDPS